MERVAVIIPCYNEASVISESVARLCRDLADRRAVSWAVVCVDDGSTDGTAQKLRELASHPPHNDVIMQTVFLPHNVGKGAAIQAGVRAIHADAYGFVDADLSIEYRTVLGEVLTGLAAGAVMVGRRKTKRAAGYSPLRTAASALFSWVAHHVFRLPAHDVQCGFKFFPHAARDIALAVEQPKFSFDLEFLIRVQAVRIPIREVVVSWQHAEHTSVRFIDGIRYVYDACWVMVRQLVKNAFL